MQEPQDTALMLGNAVIINCEAEGYPEPEITWFKGGNSMISILFRNEIVQSAFFVFLLRISFFFSFITEGKLSKEFKSLQLRNNSLTVDYVTDADEGYYMCTVSQFYASLE